MNEYEYWLIGTYYTTTWSTNWWSVRKDVAVNKMCQILYSLRDLVKKHCSIWNQMRIKNENIDRFHQVPSLKTTFPPRRSNDHLSSCCRSLFTFCSTCHIDPSLDLYGFQFILEHIDRRLHLSLNISNDICWLGKGCFKRSTKCTAKRLLFRWTRERPSAKLSENPPCEESLPLLSSYPLTISEEKGFFSVD